MLLHLELSGIYPLTHINNPHPGSLHEEIQTGQFKSMNPIVSRTACI